MINELQTIFINFIFGSTEAFNEFIASKDTLLNSHEWIDKVYSSFVVNLPTILSIGFILFIFLLLYLIFYFFYKLINALDLSNNNDNEIDKITGVVEERKAKRRGRKKRKWLKSL